MKKRKHKGFFNNLLCCFRSSSGQPSDPTTTTRTNPQHEDDFFPPGSIMQGRNLLPPLNNLDINKMCLIIDLDETLVHSSFKPINNPDFIVPVEIDGTIHQVYVLKRPYVDEFLEKMGELYECVLFTASLAKYADPVADLLDKSRVFRSRLFRESCVFYRGNYVKDLGRLGRDLHKVIIVDNSPASYIFHQDNAVPVASWFDNMSDTELRDLIPFFEKLSKVENIYTVLRNANHSSPSEEPSSPVSRPASGADQRVEAPATPGSVIHSASPTQNHQVHPLSNSIQAPLTSVIPTYTTNGNNFPLQNISHKQS